MADTTSQNPSPPPVTCYIGEGGNVVLVMPSQTHRLSLLASDMVVSNAMLSANEQILAWKSEIYQVVEHRGLARACDLLVDFSAYHLRPDTFIEDIRDLLWFFPNTAGPDVGMFPSLSLSLF